jgi:hypothetical protein
MSKRVLISLILVVVLLLGVALPAQASSSAAYNIDNGKALVGPGLIHPMGDCEDGSAGGCS